MLILMSVPLSSKLFLPWGECFCAQECDVLLGTLLVCSQSLPKSTHSPGLLAPLALAETTMQHHCTRCCSALPGSCSNCSREACWVCPLFLGLRGTSARPRELRTVEKGVCAGNLHLHSQDTFPVPIPCLILVLGCITEEQGLWLQGCQTLSVVHGQVCLVCLWLLTASDSTAPSAAA